MKRALESFYIVSPFDKHQSLKSKLLNEINKSKCDKLDLNDPYYTDKINRLDWSQSKDLNRKWVKLIYPSLKKFFEKELKSVGYEGFIIKDIWFQQYDNAGTHGWHCHGSTFTGAYYLDLPDDVPVTEISHPYDPTKQLSLKVKEGDISIFPAYSIHRSPVNLSKKTKTIVSFNIEICNPTKQILDKIKEHNKVEHSKDYLYSFSLSSIDNNELVDYSLKVEALLKRNLKRLDSTDWYGTFTTANHDKYNFLTFPNKQVSKLYREIYRNVSPLLDDKPYMIKCWLNVFRKGEKVDWHNHWPAYKKVWHGFYCVQVGESFTEYRIPKVKDIVKVKSKEGLLVVGKSEDDQHRSSPWNEEQRPRITVAFDIVPIDSVDNELRVNHFIPFKI